MSSTAEAIAGAAEHYHSGRLFEAERACREVLAFDPNCADGWNLLGATQRALGRLDVALECMERCLSLSPDSADAHSNLGAILLERGEIGRAISLHRQAIALNPDFSQAHFNLGNALRGIGELDAAVASYRRALELEPGYAKAYNNLGITLRSLGRLEDAITCYSRALEVDPYNFEACNNLGNAYLWMGNRVGAAAFYRRAISLAPDCADAHTGFAQALLMDENFEQGWLEYEWRWKTGQLPVRQFDQPRWNGEAVEGKAVLVWAEQGLGDTIQFVRYLRMVKERGARVVFECQKPLVKLLSAALENPRTKEPKNQSSETPKNEARAGSGDPRLTKAALGFDQLVAEGDALPEFDFQIPLLSLPGVFGTTLETIPATVPYLSADQALVKQWRQKLSTVEGFRIGINWHGRAGLRESRQRDVPVEMFEKLAGVPGVRMVSIQKSEIGDQRSEFGGQESGNRGAQCGSRNAEFGMRSGASAGPAIIDLGEIDTVNGAFMDTAAIMMNLDLVITSDTSVAHLAGALGVPVWVALPFVPDWRWLLNRSDSPWYPTMRLFRQKKHGDWSGAFEEIEAALRQRIKDEGRRTKDEGRMIRDKG